MDSRATKTNEATSCGLSREVVEKRQAVNNASTIHVLQTPSKAIEG